MIAAQVYVNKRIPHRFSVDDDVLFRANEDGRCDTLKPMVEFVWRPKHNGPYQLFAEFGTVDEQTSRYSTTSCVIDVAAIFHTPIYLMKGVFMVLREANLTSVVGIAMLLKGLHFRTLQRFSMNGPDPPFDALSVTRREWLDAYATGQRCKAIMISRTLGSHITNVAAPSPPRMRLPGGRRETLSFMAHSIEGHDAVTVSIGHSTVTRPFGGCHFVAGTVETSNRSLVGVTLATGATATYETALQSPQIFVAYPLKQRDNNAAGAVLFFEHVEDTLLAMVASMFSKETSDRSQPESNVPHTATKLETGRFLLEVVCFPKENAVVIPLELVGRCGPANSVRYFDSGDVISPEAFVRDIGVDMLPALSRDSRELAYTVKCNWGPLSAAEWR